MGRTGNLREEEEKVGLFRRKEKPEERADPGREVDASDSLLRALISGTDVDKTILLQIPAVRGCLEKIAGTVCRLPIKLYRKVDGKVEEITEDARLRLLNKETGDTLNADEFWRAMLEDYYLGRGAYAYIRKNGIGEYEGLHYVEEEKVSVLKNYDQILKSYSIMVMGKTYHPFEFLKLHRRTKDGAEGIPLWQDNPLIFSVAYNSFVFEEKLVKKGGNKRGFIEAEDRLDKGAIESIKRAWNNLYSNNTDNVVVLNKGAKFKESSNTSVEMQLNENKESNAKDICGMFGFSSRILYGEATEEDRKEYINAVMSLLNVIETALDKDLLTEKEKESFYFAFDTKELTRGSLKERYEAYALGLTNNFLQIDEVRAKEDMEPLGFKWVRIGLNDVLLDVEKGIVYTPNMNAVADLNNPKGGEGNED
ncbi:MAG TPA: phage portal protein [Tyzzerella sp.]|nr:phage portal protein [Tyzzerella sp.]